jgi:quercetin dioxygenase-like cupin family protein
MGEAREFYNLNDGTHGQLRDLAPGLSARVFVGDHSMLSLVTFEPNGEGEIHSHPEEQWGVLLEGDGVRTQEGKEHPVKAGDFWRTPGGVPHGFRAGPDGARILDIFSPRREAYKKPGAGFGKSD